MNLNNLYRFSLNPILKENPLKSKIYRLIFLYSVPVGVEVEIARLGM